MSKTNDITALEAAEHKREAVAEVALRVGVSSDFVRKVLAGSRRNEKVERAMRLLLKERAKAQLKFQSDKKGA